MIPCTAFRSVFAIGYTAFAMIDCTLSVYWNVN